MTTSTTVTGTIGTSSNNTLTDATGNQTYQGGAGTDILVYAGAVTDYTVTRNTNGSYSVVKTSDPTLNTDTLWGIEQIQFSTTTTTQVLVAVPTFSFQANDSSASEGDVDQSVDFRVNLSHAYDRDIEIHFGHSGSATPPAYSTVTNVGDYLTPTTSLIIAAGQTTATYTITVKGDSFSEIDENINIDLERVVIGSISQNLEGYDFVNSDDKRVTHTIMNNDPNISFSTTVGATSEGNAGFTTVTVTAQLNSATTTDVTVPITFTGSAISGMDYTNAPTSITIAAGSTTRTASFTVSGDTTYEPTETVVLTMGTPTGATLGANSTYTHTITNEDAIPTVSFNTTAGTTNEGNGGSSRAVFVSATLTNASSADVIVPISFTTSSATSGIDYTDVPTSITIAAGRTTGTASFTVIGDTTYEPTETVVLTMGTPTGANLGANNTTTHMHTIQDDDAAAVGVGVGGGTSLPTVSFATMGGAASEGFTGVNTTVTVYANLSQGSPTGLSVPITFTGTALSGTDYTPGAASFEFSPNMTTASTNFIIKGDIFNTSTNDAITETVTLNMGTPAGYSVGTNPTYTHTIIDDDGVGQPSIFFTTSSGATVEGNTAVDNTIVTVTANLSQGSPTGFTVPITFGGTAISGTGYTPGTNLVFGPDITIATTSFTIKGDTTYQPTETVVLSMAAPNGYALAGGSTYTHTIINDDAVVPSVSFSTHSGATNEGNGGSSHSVFVTAQLDSASATNVIVPISFAGTATSGIDYTDVPASITIAAGRTTGTASFTILGDTTFDEFVETVTITMGNPTGAILAPAATPYLHTINDDDVGVAITNNTPTAASPTNPVITAVAGFDTLDLSAVSSASLTTPIYVYADYGVRVDNNIYNFPVADGTPAFDRFVTNNVGGTNFFGSQTVSEVVQLKAISSNDIRLDNSPDGYLAAETDVVDYSATTLAVTVNLGATTTADDGNVYATASKAIDATTVMTDKISGAEGIIGSSGNDDITGNARSNLLVGGAGNDKLDGGAGNDVLIGGVGTGVGEVLIGGTGKDMLIDLDGATLRGSDTAKAQGAAGDKDVFVVRTGATIENYHVARDGAGLAGRAFSSANDTIVFNLSLVALTSSLGDLRTAIAATVTPLTGSQLQDVLENIKRDIDIRVERITIAGDSTANDWVAIASYNGSWRSSDQATAVELARVVLKDMTTLATGSVLTDVALPDFSMTSPQYLTPEFDKIDSLVFNQVSDLLVEDEAINIGFMLEAVRAGTVRDIQAGNLMFGDFNASERIFNPGAGDQKIFGSNSRDTYEFVVQDLKTNAGAPTQNAGNDRILDTGGDDAVAFSNITLSQIAALDFEAVKFGREAGNYTLKSNYSQTDGTITNSGEFTWLGHFREGFGMGLEQIKLGTTILEMADVRYTAGSKTPSQVASGGLDTIMVGGAGVLGAASKFVVEDGVSRAAFDTGRNLGSDAKQHLFLWDAEANDVIDLKDFISSQPTAAALAAAVVKDGSSVAGKQSFNINLDATAEFELMIHFMGTSMGASVEESILEAMITKAYAA